MTHDLNRRDFLRSTVVSAAAIGSMSQLSSGAQPVNESKPLGVAPKKALPVVIASGNGLPATEKAAELLLKKEDPLEAVVSGVTIVEADPEDQSVGYGGLPNEDGVVQLDSSVMHGPLCTTGAVAALENILYASRVAQLVLHRTDHAMLVGEGALRFAKAHGFKEQDMLTEDARKAWLKWKENLSDKDDWLPPATDGKIALADGDEIPFTTGTINCCCLDLKGDLAGVTTTSGLSYKIPGRVGDSPIIGAGLYVDNEVGAAGSTGRGEAVIESCGSFAIVELMRNGMHPKDACKAVLQRIIKHNKFDRLKREDGKPNFNVQFYAIRRDGAYGAASLWSGATFAIYSGGKNRLEECEFLFEKK